jgi:NAD(P)H-hydrate epimerase
MAVPPRPFNFHKSQAGRVGIVAGSRGFTGAAALAASGAARAGAGLVTLFVSDDIYPTLAATVIPEVMVRPVNDYTLVLEENLDALVLGPGLGKSHASEILTLIENDPRPVVVDADALNVLAISGTGLLKKCAGPRLLTPHPGEMRRLLEGSDIEDTDIETLSRREVARRFCRAHPVTLLYKGARTIVAEEGRPLRYNTTGNPGMATGGCGDVLSGVCAALLAGGTGPFDSACIASWLLGRAAEIQVYESGQSAESMLAGDIAFSLGAAYRDLRNGYY